MYNWLVILLLVMAIVAVLATVIVGVMLLRRFFSPRALITLTIFLIYVLLMARVKESGVLDGYEGSNFLMEVPLNVFDWIGNLVKEVLEAPQEFCEGVTEAVKDFAGKLMAADSLENVMQIVLDKLFDLFREILDMDIEEKVGPHLAGREGWKAFSEVYIK